MSRLNIDLSKVKDPTEPVPEDTYILVVNAATLTKSKASGNPMVALEYEIVGGDHAGRKLFDNAVLNNQFGQFRARQIAVAAGDDETDPDPDSWVGAELDAEVTIQESEDDDGNTRRQNRIRPLVEID